MSQAFLSFLGHKLSQSLRFMAGMACTPTYRPRGGDEDRLRHSQTAGCFFYTVGCGYQLGIFTDEFTARKQVTGFSDGKWKKSATWDEAMAVWVDISVLSFVSVFRGESSALTAHTTLALDAGRAYLTTPYALDTGCTWSRPFPTHCARGLVVGIQLYFPRTAPCISTSSGTTGSKRPSAGAIYEEPRGVDSGRHSLGYRGVALLFEDRYDLVDHIFNARLSPAVVMETRNERKLVAFVRQTAYMPVVGDPEESD
ncbi:hypothetical protein B0H13DRAFT_2389623 [Mycena leptocephala]|nr:hypothetical protein B0H13DRAFT_2389623 [Mycena leptocephala]